MSEIYLDNCATTRVDDGVAEACLDMMRNRYGNPSSLHKKGIEAGLALEEARGSVASALGCDKSEVYFTSGGTEANNIAIFGAAGALARSGKTIVTTAWEHSSVLGPARELERRGYTLKLVNPGADGHIDIDKLADAVDGDTVLVSCMLVNSEVGGITDIAALARNIRRQNPKTLLHCDAVQGFGKIPFSAKKLGVDFLSVSGHKLHAPKGVGALFARKGARILPLSHGGGQEKALRPGTESTPLIAGFSVAAGIAAENLNENLARITKLREYFVNKCGEVSGLCMNSPADSTPYICNISAIGYRSEIMLHYLATKGIFVSSGSACSSGRPSHVLTAMGLKQNRVDSALRISFSKYSTENDVDVFFEALAQGMREIRA